MDLLRKTLDHCGYNEEAATPENVVKCFYDYVDSGVFRNIDLDEARDIVKENSIETICKNLLRY